MRKIRLSDTDLELFDIEIGPEDYTYYQRHKDAFKTMWREQGKPFWTRFQITFRSFTVKHGVIKHMNIDSPKFQNILDEAFIFIHEQFVDGKESTARNFIDDVARLAQNQDKFPALDSKSFSKDPFFTRDTRELFRKFFGTPDQKATYLKVYILCPVYLRFGGSVCRCLIRWMDAEIMTDPTDDSYWTPPQAQATTESTPEETIETTMCSKCIDDCGTKYFHEKIMGNNKDPVSLSFWTKGDPRFNDSDNPLFAPHMDPNEDWRNGVSAEMFRDFYNYAKFKYGEGCSGCTRLKKKRDKVIHVCKASKRKKKQQVKNDQELLIQDLREFRDRINEFDDDSDKAPECEEYIHEVMKDKPRLKEFLDESGIKPPGADRRAAEAERLTMVKKLQTEQLKEEIKRQALAEHERRKNIESERRKHFTKQIGSVRICKHLADNEKAVAYAQQLDRCNRERSPNAPHTKCTCFLGNPALTENGENGLVKIRSEDIKAEINGISYDNCSSSSSPSAGSRDSSVEKNIKVDDVIASGGKDVDDKCENENTNDNCSVKRDELPNFIADEIIESNMLPKPKADDKIEEIVNTSDKTAENDDNHFNDNQADKIEEKVNAISEIDKFPVQEVAGREGEDEQKVGITETEENVKTDSDNSKTDTVKQDIDIVKNDGDNINAAADNMKTDADSVNTDSVNVKTDDKNLNIDADDVNTGSVKNDSDNVKPDTDNAKTADSNNINNGDDNVKDDNSEGYGDHQIMIISKLDDNDDGNDDDKFPVQEQGEPDNQTNIFGGFRPNVRVNTAEERKNFLKCDHGQDKDASKKDSVTGFKVIKIEDQKNNLYEVNVSVACVKPGEEVKEDDTEEMKKEKLKKHVRNHFRLSTHILKEKIPGLPQRFEWWEGRGFAVAVVNYEEEEKEFCKHWTHFTLKINGYKEVTIKQTMIQLLMYVSKRKRRTCYGWNMEVDDIVACILPEDHEKLEDLSISVSRGFRFEDRLTDFERTTLLNHYPNLNLGIVLCGIEQGAIVKTMETKRGKDKLRKIIDYVADKEIITKDLPLIDVEKLSKKLNKVGVTHADVLWEQLIRKPDKFEMYALLDKEYVLSQTDWWELGMRNKDIRMYNTTKDDLPKICPVCKTLGLKCHCQQACRVEPKVVELVEHTDYDKVKVLGDENGPDLGKMKYTETNLNMENKNEKVDKKQAKASKKKEKRIELKDLPAKFAEVGIDADKTMITIPSNDKEPMLKKVPIPGTDKNENMAPIPGVQSSMNFTFQKGKREQTINVTLGAYMPEEKITALQDKKEKIRLLEEETKRLDAQVENVTNVKKDKKKKKKKEKNTKTSTENNETSNLLSRDNSELTAKLLQGIFRDEEKVNEVRRQINQHMGVTNKMLMAEKSGIPGLFVDDGFMLQCSCPGHDAIFEMVKKRPLPKTVDEKDKLIQEALGISEVISKKGRKKITQIQIKDTPNKCECGKCEVEAIETFGIQVMEKKEVKKAKKSYNVAEAILKAKMAQSEVSKATVDTIPDKDVDAINDSSEQSNMSKKARKRAAKKQKENGISVAEKSDTGKDGSSDEKESQPDGILRTCGHCQKIEPSRKTFKKCQKCKDEGVLDVRYYCSRECQLDDWKNKHKMEHKDGLLG
ncbi:hypothetical protein ACF0H5_014066 [Mactra antiquata]